MRKLFALVIIVFHLLQSAAAWATPISDCCLDPCPGPAQCATPGCAACPALPGLVGAIREPTPDATAAFGHHSVMPPSHHASIWRPPD
ncbi:hypothetical protein [Rhizobacter sp. Root1221]|uniref:hypothetical protein n=1 Tax=Rhizobacter sp. Root1221 TaxID=1736433 RepID=UPI0006FF45D0|nr:hypothetical protein [Rhizobacter sp. Root1221]KQV81234.1 hypothetical protein ASC87_09920 [Rhizobacter sp. Root1221]